MSNMQNARPYKVGRQVGEALCETASILYLLDNREQFLTGIKAVIDREIDEVKLLRESKK